jgi:vanillate O-demethylase ferredoxin subunit
LHLARSGKTLDVPADKHPMDVILDAGVDLPISCEQGVCGTCITAVIDGIPDHRDQCLSAAERTRSFTPCCSRSLSDVLTIDL